jgi:hypothetical protein
MRLQLLDVLHPSQAWPGTTLEALSQLAWAHLKAVAIRSRRLRAPQVQLLDLGLPSASKPNVVAYDRHVLFAADDPVDATRHRSPCPISTTRIDEAFVHEMPEELVGLVFAQADLVAYAGERV